ncbi:DeoR/GlpR transcriptional regulator [Sporosarcina sp. Marseille-Q4063]|uniref:DeoR/GlpR family DNA-binding transcription regulator n=1 Tax=Sporosarcina sp. Marseille-Q4063 TaxID=2810514 RepID=UPI001BAFC8F3|nr:DeoR/GlpR family DNA-binding transcription regulator [Sporosarcina sp. Marseille-Q4063]QUW21507.1 DeoR/GlpR transcriptional regulator [Sporosarcina sp. Marseille-Q4063]
MSFLAEERQKIILEEIDIYGKVHVIPLAKRFNVSNETIRRDLEALVKTNKLKRVYGGAVKTSYPDGEPPYQQREIINFDAKQAIGKEAASLINDGDTIFLDTGTTILELARFIQGNKRVTIITNSLPTANLIKESLAQRIFTGKLIILGGEVSAEQQSISGYLCEEMLKKFYVDKAFISVGGISIQTGISDYDLTESKISEIATSMSKEVIVLADHSKIGVQSFSFISAIDMVNVIICDKKPTSAWNKVLERQGVTWITARKL